MDRHDNEPNTVAGSAWLAEYERQKRTIDGETSAEAWDRAREWAKENKAPKELASRLRWQHTYHQVRDCQKEYIAYKWECCGDRTRPIAVPIGCNHRLCPFCSRRRSELARERLKVLYDRFEHPQFLTLTVPNYSSISKEDFQLFRKRVRALLKQYDGYVKGGVLSLETTYNRRDKTWHLHAHVLFDAAVSLPPSSWAMELNGRKELAFGLVKKRMEFDWLRLWTTDWYKAPRRRRNKKGMQRALADERYIFEAWLSAGWEHKTHRMDRKLRMQVVLPGLSQEEYAARVQWNRQNRRVVDLRPVINRDKAVKEVLKYITKVAQFSDCPEAVEAFANATRGARLIQTFGSWYGVNLELDVRFDAEQMESNWSAPKCACGLNMRVRIPGTLFSKDVEMDSAGMWHPKRSLCDHLKRGTVSRPTIRALERSPGKEDFDGRTDTYNTDNAPAHGTALDSVQDWGSSVWDSDRL
jgi:hypothetical protein